MKTPTESITMSTTTRPIAAAPAEAPVPHLGRLDTVGYLICLGGIVRRELLRFFNQKERFFSALVRPLVWLFIFAAGFRNTLGVSIEPPYQTYVLYEVYVVPGLAVMIQLFNGMQSSLSMVYDREVGS
jgi:ABC-2 type transport system permease protein